MVTIVGNNNSVFNHFIQEIRDVEIQQDRMKFRRNLERIGEICAYELSKTLEFEQTLVETPLGQSKVNTLKSQPVIATVFRAGLPLHNGVLNYFDQAENAFVSAFRNEHEDGSFDVEVDYIATPSLENKILIITDTMLATGRSMVLTYQALLTKGIPKEIHIVSAIGSSQGVEYTLANLPQNTKIWIGAVDEVLTSRAYISPGLGDAGDLAYGGKM